MMTLLTTGALKAACKAACRGDMSDSLDDLLGTPVADAIRSGVSTDVVVIVDDASDRPHNQEATICVLADIKCTDGVQRVVYYKEGAFTVLADGSGYLITDGWIDTWNAVNGDELFQRLGLECLGLALSGSKGAA
jgi:hypothetical protein